MKEALITLTTAKLAKEKGFDEPCLFYYDDNYHHGKELTHHGADSDGYDWERTNSELKDTQYAVSTQSELQRWLREKHKIHIEVLLSDDTPFDKFFARTVKKELYFTLTQYGDKNTYEEALEEGLQSALNLIE